MEAALLLANRRTSSLVVTLHNGLPRMTRLQQSLGHLAQMMLKRVVRRSKAVIAPHDVFAESAFGWLEVNDRLHIVPPGVDHTRFRSLGMERDDDEVLFVGHVRPEKGLHVLVEALVRLPKRRLKVMASVSYEAKYFRAIRARAETVLGPRVSFHLDPSVKDLEAAYNRAACVVVPSLDLESWNLVLLEAASTGAACVRTDLPGLAWADFAIDVLAGDSASLADAIEHAIENRKDIGPKAEQRANEYSWQRTCRETLAVYAAVAT